jgi:penicillin amidase
MRRFVFLFVATLIVLLAIGAGGVWWRLWHALPTTEGRARVPGLRAPLEIVRDGSGVPHIRAANEADAYFGLGYVHAQDRLWQMDFQRRIARGRLSEILGSQTITTDRWFRTLGFGRLAAKELAGISADGKAILEAYTRGVNAVIASQQGNRRPIEFSILGFDVEPWTVEDCLIWAKVMSLVLDTNHGDELLRAKVMARAGQDAAAALMPDYTGNSPVILPEGIAPSAAAARTAAGDAFHAAARIAESTARAARIADGVMSQPNIPLGDRGGSNNWVVSGARSVTGKPLLASDPHLGAALPSAWYLAHLEGGSLNVVGATLPGTPAVPIGHNARVAWGVTNLMADVQDLYVEHLNAGQAAEFKGTWEPLRLVHETIRIKGQPDEQLLVRLTRHGPIISDVLPAGGEALALRWTALDDEDRLIDAYRGVSLAKNWEEFTVAAAGMHSPVLNFVYADVDGNIGYFAPGAIPIRAAGHDGTLPVPGWSGEYEWIGYVPSEQLPRIYNPTRGFVASANNRALPDGYPYVLSTNWEPGYRAARITELIEASPQHSIESIARIQADLRTPQVRVLLPWLQRARPADDESSAALGRLRRWDGVFSAESSDAAVFSAWVTALTARLFADDLGPTLWNEWSRWPHWQVKALDRLVTMSDDRWCDDVRTEGTESCEEILGLSLRVALDGLTARRGSADPSTWHWGDDNVVAFPHAPFDAVGFLRPLFSRRLSLGGSGTTVNPVMRMPDGPVIASYRQIVDLANFDNSRFVHPLGQSGQLGSSHYADLLEPWRRVEYVPMLYSRAAVDKAARERLVLEPQ